MAWSGVITDVGNAALERSIADAEEINLNLVKIGTGYIPPADMKAATDLNTPIGTASLDLKESVSAGVRIVCTIFPETTSHVIKEVGLFGTFENTSILFALYQNPDGVEIPSSTDYPDFSYSLSAILDIDDLETLTITVDPSALVSQASLTAGLNTRVSIAQGAENAGKFLVVNAAGNVVPTTVPFANGVSF